MSGISCKILFVNDFVNRKTGQKRPTLLIPKLKLCLKDERRVITTTGDLGTGQGGRRMLEFGANTILLSHYFTNVHISGGWIRMILNIV
jgi:hypothetical protein